MGGVVTLFDMRKMRTSNIEHPTSNMELGRKAASSFLCSMFVFILLLCSVIRASPDLRRYDTRYYTIYTDIDPEQEKEAAIRMTRMAEEYHERTRSFSGQITSKLPFYLYKSPDDYFTAGGLPGSAGCFISIGSDGKLMAIAGRNTTLQTWHVVQHEGFHQFAHAVIGGQIPTWLNEGLAEFFGESIFTGDGFVTGVIPPWRLARLKDEINDGDLRPLRQIMGLSAQQWANEMNIKNYDQAWSMVHFLVYGDDQKYQQAFGDCIREISSGHPFDVAWTDTMGPVDGFDQKWKDWWLKLPTSPTSTLYGRAAVATMTSFVARAFAAKQSFTDFAEFRSTVDGNSLKNVPNDWLPRSLIVTAFRLYGSQPGWELHSPAGKLPTVELTLLDGTRLTGSFTLHDARVEKVTVEVDDMIRILAEAKTLLDSGKKDKARALVQTALADNPKSALAGDARRFLRSFR
jgi:hypothetical protein